MRSRYSGRALALLGAATLALVALASLAGSAAAAATNSEVSITRDRAGIPHIRASNFKALGYGDGYAFAQDNLCTLADQIVTVEGKRSQYFGPSALAINYSAGTFQDNLTSDLYWRYVQATGLAKKLVSSAMLPQVRNVYRGYAAGYNAYLRSGHLRDPRCKGKPWVHPITLGDLALRGLQISTEASAQQFIQGIVAATPPAAKAAAAHAGAHPQLHLQALKERLDGSSDRSVSGSNGIGIGSLDTRSGHGIVLANPHFPWRGTERFWMAQLTVPGQYDVEGGTLEGFPLIGIGFNRHIAWTHTVSTSRRFAIYQLKLVPGDPLSYYVDGNPEKMGHVTVSVTYNGKTVTHTFYTTRWGPVMNVAEAGYNWSPSSAYALYDVVMPAAGRAANEFLRMGQANSVHALFNVEAKYLAIPTFNTIAADDEGNAYYGDVGAVPNISQAKLNLCLPAGLPTLVFDADRVVTLDGSRSSCAPDNDPGTPARGIFNATHLPHLFRRDYVENSNDSFWLANPSSPLTGFSPVIGLTNTQQGLRTRLGNEMIAQRIAGTDRLGKPKFTIGTLQRMWESDRSGLAELVLSSLTADCRAHPVATASSGQVVDLTAACAALAGYDGTGALNAKGGWLFSEWYAHDNASNFWSDAFNRAAPLSTPSHLNTADPATLRALADAVLELNANHVPLDASYGRVQHAVRGRAKIPIHGCDTGCFNAIYASNGLSTNPLTKAPYGVVYDGSSLVMTTELRPSGPVSEGILTYSQATDPSSRWFANMTRLYSKRRWVKLPYTVAALRRSHPLRTLVLRVR